MLYIHFRIPKKGGKKDDKGSSGSTLRKAAEVVDDGKYKYSYGQGQKQSRPPYGQQKSFEKPKDQSLDLMGLMTGIKNTLKKEAKPQFEETKAGKEKAKQEQRQQGGQKQGPMILQTGENPFQLKNTSAATTPTPAGGDKAKDPELEALLAERVKGPDGVINALTGFFDENRSDYIFKCFICTKQIDGKANLMIHLDGDRHKRYRKLNFKELDEARSRKVPTERPICRFFAETGICKRFKTACPNRHERPMLMSGENPFQATESAATFKPGTEPKFLYKAEPQQGPMILTGDNPFQSTTGTATFKSGGRPPAPDQGQHHHRRDHDLMKQDDSWRDIPNGRPGDWLCPKCSKHNFSRNTDCFRCKTPKY